MTEKATTTISGTARDAKLGAVVVREDGGAVYVGGLGSWPAELAGRQVEVTGRLVHEAGSHEPLVDDAGAHRAGALGGRTVIEDATWRLAGGNPAVQDSSTHQE